MDLDANNSSNEVENDLILSSYLQLMNNYVNGFSFNLQYFNYNITSMQNYMNTYNNNTENRGYGVERVNRLNRRNRILNRINRNISNSNISNSNISNSNISNSNSNISNTNIQNNSPVTSIPVNASNLQDSVLSNYSIADFSNVSKVNLINIINNNIKKSKYSEIVEPLNESCCITQYEFCGDDEVAMITECKHICKYDALYNWLSQHQTCPICRYNILTKSNIIRYDDPDDTYRLFLYENEFKFFIANNIITNLLNRLRQNATATSE